MELKAKLIIDEEKNSSVFMKLMAATAKRDGFRLHPAEHYEKVLASPMVKQITIYPHTQEVSVESVGTDDFSATMAKNNQSSAHMGVGVYNDRQAVAIGVFVGFGDTFTYLYGASDYDSRQLMSPYLIQWQGIKLGQKLGFDFYDFFGIAPVQEMAGGYKYNEKHQYAGVTRFKLGFGGQPKESVGTMDLILSPMKYNLYRLMRKIRRVF